MGRSPSARCLAAERVRRAEWSSRARGPGPPSRGAPSAQSLRPRASTIGFNCAWSLTRSSPVRRYGGPVSRSTRGLLGCSQAEPQRADLVQVVHVVCDVYASSSQETEP